MSNTIRVLAHNLRQAFDARSWHGTNLWGSIRSITAEEAAWRPQAGRHNVWELTVHAAYWKYRVYRLVSEAPPRNFDLRGSNFFLRPDPTGQGGWEDDRERLRAWHNRLLAAVEDFPSDRLPEPVGSNGHTFEGLILGAASHDLYHAGQIQLLKRLREGSG